MNVKQLRKILAQIPDGDVVMLATDEEGNSFKELNQVDDNSALDGFGGVGLRDLSVALLEQGYAKEDLAKGDPCVVLWP